MAKLTQKIVDAAGSDGADLGVGLHSDSETTGLYLQVQSATSRSWIFKFKIAGKTRQMGLGAAKDVPLDTARKKALAARLQKLDKVDPVEARAKAQAEDAAATIPQPTFREAAKAWIEAQRPTWTSVRHADQVGASFENYVYPRIGSKRISDVDAALIADVLRPIWHDKRDTAMRVQQRIHGVFKRAIRLHPALAMHNPADLDAMRDILGRHAKRAKVHFASLPVADIPAFMPALRERDSTSALALEFTILTAARANEAAGARWSEFNPDLTVWTIPAERMKGRVEHTVPLSARAVAILQVMKGRRESEYVFPSYSTRRSINPLAMLVLLKKILDRPDLTVHGFRRTFKSWARTRSTHEREAVEEAMAHKIGNAVEQAYVAEVMLEKRRHLMNDWAAFCATDPTPAQGDNVVRLRA